MRISDWSSDVCSSDLAAYSTLTDRPSLLDCPITFIPVTAVSISEFAKSVTTQCGIPVRVTQDALAMLNGYATSVNTGGITSGEGNRSDERREGKECVR